MSQKLYLECYAGISGDMTVGALLDLGADEEVLRRALGSLPISGFRIQIGRRIKNGLDTCDFQVILDKEHENHDSDMEYLHGHDHIHEQVHTHAHEHAHEHIHVHPHEHRSLPDILSIIARADITPRAKETAERIFRILAEAEAKAHGIPAAEVHFHEVGAVDSIVDILAAAVCLDNLDITEVIVPALCEGGGYIRCQHGMIPVPVPAVLNIAEAHQIPFKRIGCEGEFVTPTGAAIVAAVRTSGTLPDTFTVKRTGISSGKRNYERPSILRAMLIEETGGEKDVIYKLESNIDDCTGEAMGHTMEMLLTAGARDVYYTPIFMKKNRPAFQLNVICTREKIGELEAIIFRETTTIGIRRLQMERTVLEREIKEVATPLGRALVKICRLPDGKERIYPEYESVAALCRQSGQAFQEVYQLVQASSQFS